MADEIGERIHTGAGSYHWAGDAGGAAPDDEDSLLSDGEDGSTLDQADGSASDDEGEPAGGTGHFTTGALRGDANLGNYSADFVRAPTDAGDFSTDSLRGNTGAPASGGESGPASGGSLGNYSSDFLRGDTDGPAPGGPGLVDPAMARHLEGLGLGPSQQARFAQLSGDDQEHFLSGMERTNAGGHFGNDQEADAYEAVMGDAAVPMMKRGIRTEEDYAREAMMWTPVVPDIPYNPDDFAGSEHNLSNLLHHPLSGIGGPSDDEDSDSGGSSGEESDGEESDSEEA